MSNGDSVYSRPPLAEENGVRIFSSKDRYIANYDRIAADHLAAVAKNGQNPWMPEVLWTEMEASTVELVAKYAREGDAILDVGVGLGRLLSHFPALQRYGMDISAGYLAISKSKGIEVCLSRIEDMPYKPGTFDIIVCTDVLEHVFDLNLCVTRMLDVLKDDGVLIVRVPVHEDLHRYLSPDFPYEFVHVRGFNEESLQLLFERIFNCRCEEVTPGGYWPLGDRLRISVPFGRLASIAFRGFRYVPVVRSLIYRPLLTRLFHPIDANIVVRKRPVTS